MELGMGPALPGVTHTGMCWDTLKLLGGEQRKGQHRRRNHRPSELLLLAKATPGQQKRA